MIASLGKVIKFGYHSSLVIAHTAAIETRTRCKSAKGTVLLAEFISRFYLSPAPRFDRQIVQMNVTAVVFETICEHFSVCPTDGSLSPSGVNSHGDVWQADWHRPNGTRNFGMSGCGSHINQTSSSSTLSRDNVFNPHSLQCELHRLAAMRAVWNTRVSPSCHVLALTRRWLVVFHKFYFARTALSMLRSLPRATFGHFCDSSAAISCHGHWIRCSFFPFMLVDRVCVYPVPRSVCACALKLCA